MPEEEQDRIKSLLGAGQSGDQAKLSDIFLVEGKKDGDRLPGADNDAFHAMRSLKQEIDDEIDNKNLMLKDYMYKAQLTNSQQ